MAAPLHVHTVPLDELHGDPANARRHDDKNRQAIQDSLSRFGQVEPLVVQAKTGRVVGGNGRLEVMRAMGWKSAQVVRLELDDVQAAALGITLNRTGELAAWDTKALESIVGGLESSWDLKTLGFDEEELQRLLKDNLDMAQMPEEAPQSEHESFQEAAPPTTGTPTAAAEAPAASHVRMVQLFYNQETATEFYTLADQAQGLLGTEHLSETVLAALARVAGEPVEAGRGPTPDVRAG